MRAKGVAYEELACNFLRKKGLKPLDRNFHCRRGEIDLIMQHNDTLVFVEVRYRKSYTYGSAAESIDTRKQRKLCLAASHFLTEHNLWDLNCRFDTVTINNAPSTTNSRFEWIKGAFDNRLGI